MVIKENDSACDLGKLISIYSGKLNLDGQVEVNSQVIHCASTPCLGFSPTKHNISLDHSLSSEISILLCDMCLCL